MSRIPRCDWCDKPGADLVHGGGARYHEACFLKRAAVLHECDDAATIRRLKGQLAAAGEEREDYRRRFETAVQEIEALRARLDRPRMQAAAPRETT